MAETVESVAVKTKHCSFLVSKLREFSRSNLFTDFEITDSLQTIYVHSLLLSAAMGRPVSGKKWSVQVPDNPTSLLDKFSELIYSGKATLEGLQGGRFLTLIRLLREIYDVSLQYKIKISKDHIVTISIQNYAVKVYDYIQSLKSNSVNCDLNIVFEDFSQMSVHGAIIASACSKLVHIYKMSLLKTERATIHFQNVKKNEFNAFAELCYDGKAAIPASEMEKVMRVAVILGVNEILPEHLRKTAPDYAVNYDYIENALIRSPGEICYLWNNEHCLVVHTSVLHRCPFVQAICTKMQNSAEDSLFLVTDHTIDDLTALLDLGYESKGNQVLPTKLDKEGVVQTNLNLDADETPVVPISQEDDEGPETSSESSEISTFICDLCDKIFTRKYNLIRHRASIHNVCDVCGLKCSSEKALQEHCHTLHSEDTVWLCESCNDPLTNKTFFEHYLKCSSESKGTCTPCTECGIDFSEEGLRRHMKVHSSKYWCEICQKNFASKLTLTRHLKYMHNSTLNKENPVLYGSEIAGPSSDTLMAENTPGNSNGGSLAETMKCYCDDCAKVFNLLDDQSVKYDFLLPRACTVCEETILSGFLLNKTIQIMALQ